MCGHLPRTERKIDSLQGKIKYNKNAFQKDAYRPQRQPSPRRVCFPGVCFPGGVLPGGVLPGGVLPKGCTWSFGGTCPGTPPCGQTDTCKNLTFTTSLRTVKIVSESFSRWFGCERLKFLHPHGR